MSNVNKDIITFAMTKNAKDFTNSINNILHQKAMESMTGKVPEIVSALFNNGYRPASGDEQEFVDQHTITVVDYPVKNEDGVPFTAGNIKHVSPGGIKMEENSLEEKMLTKPEMKKREEIVMALKKSMKPKTDAEKSKMYAIATAQAKKSA